MYEQPASVTRALWAIVLLVVMGAAATVLIVVLRNDLLRSWAEGNASARPYLRAGGLPAVESSSLQPPAYAPVAIVLFVVVASLMGVLAVFFRNGEHWARLCLTGLVLFTTIATVGAIRTTPPLVFIVIAVVSVAVEVVALALVWHPDTSAFIRGDWPAGAVEPAVAPVRGPGEPEPEHV